MENFKIYSTYDLKGNMLEQLKKIHAQSTSLESKLSSLSVSINKLGELNKLNGLLLKFKDFSTVVESSSSHAKGLSREVSQLSQQFTKLSVASAESNRNLKSFGMLSVGAGAGSGGGRRRHGALGGMVEGVGHGSGESFLAGRMLSGGAIGLGAIAGYGLYRAGKGGYEAQNDYQRLIVQMKAAGLSDSQIKEASGLRSGGISRVNMLSAFADSFMATRNFEDSKALAPTLAKAMIASHIAFNDLSADQERSLVRFAEIKSGGHLDQMSSALNTGYKIMNVSSGSLKPSELRTFMRQASGVVPHMSDLGLISLEPVIQELGGNRAGTSIQTGAQMLGTHAGSLVNKERVKDLLKAGIFGNAVFGKNGKIISTQTNDDWYNLYERDPFAFMNKLIGVYQKQGDKTPEQIDQRFRLDFPNTTARFFTTMHKAQIKTDSLRSEASKVGNIDQSLDESKGSQMAASTNLEQAKKNLALTWGEFSSPAVISGMNFLNKFLGGLSTTIKELGKLQGITKYNPINLTLSGINSLVNPKSKLDDSEKKMADQILGGGYSKKMIYGANQPQQPTKVFVQIDGKTIAEAVTKEQANSMSFGGTLGSQQGLNPLLDPSPFGISHFGGAL